MPCQSRIPVASVKNLSITIPLSKPPKKAPKPFVNFDGFKDFLIRSYGSMAMFELTNIYLFDNKTKSFVYSDLSDNGIETDSINRKLTTSSFDRDFEKTKIHYFDKFGKAKYTQVITKYLDSTYEVKYRTIEKIVNGKVVEKDSTEIKE